MKAILLTVVFALALSTEGSFAAPNFPMTRNAVGPGEYYVLEEFDEWVASCLRGEDDDDICEASTTLTAMEEGLELHLSIFPFMHYRKPARANVDVLPVALVDISPYSNSAHYHRFSAAITSIDGDPFDGYWCQLTELVCSRGPELDRNSTDQLLSARYVVVAIYDVDPETADEIANVSDNFTVKPVKEFELSMRNFRKAYERANRFSADVSGIDLDNNETQVKECAFSYRGRNTSIRYTYDEDYDVNHTTMREMLRGPRGSGDCPSYVMLASLTPDMTPSQRDLFCLDYEKDAKTYQGFQMGEANAYGVCVQPTKAFCSRVNDAKTAAVAITGFATGAVGGTVGATAATGTTVVAHSSGAAILTGSGGYIAGTLGTIGTTAIGILTAPVTVTAAAVSVVAVGGAVYVCSE
ncbi:hypothetical protein MU516_13105 [Paracoccus sp. YLB-12]|uniref:Uncharacterized protein n=1 Tax=Paracoccus maritimus TaxID=2933292 RepID=A0ABT2KBS7_9RHOB|nr:hypothetical protein [Paracoccus sp. YLB-12]MCT4333801.1 hypothetical protein [Paracoccus sp. YLB-12]